MKQVKFIRNVSLGVKNLLLHKLRSLLTMLGVVFGVGSVVAMLAVGEGASKQALDQIRKLGSNNILIDAQKPLEEAASGTQRTQLSIYGLQYEDLHRLRETMPGVRRTVPVKVVRKDGRLGSRSMELRVVGSSADWFELVERPIIAGRVVLASDEKDRANVVVLTEHGARRLLATENSIGQTLRIGANYYQVVGIVKNESSDPNAAASGGFQTPDKDVDAYIPIDLAREHFGDFVTRRSAGSFERELVELHQIIVEVEHGQPVEAVAANVTHMLEQFHKKKDYDVKVPLALLRQAEATKRTFNIVLGSIAGISLLVGGIGIMNIMLASVTERTREIGIRRAIGAKRKQIIGQFLIETVVLSTAGGLVGVGIGVLMPLLIEYYAKMPTQVTTFSVTLSVGISMLVGIVFGLYPAVRAANLDPIVALRHE